MPLTIALDADDVLADLVPRWLELYNKDYSDNLTPQDITEWAISKIVKPECGPKIYEYLKLPDLYTEVQPIFGSFMGISALREAGHKIIIATAGYSQGKIDWLIDFEYAKSQEEIFFASDKSFIRADILVDDKPASVAEFPGHAILFSRPWNYSFAWPWRADNWSDVVRMATEYSQATYIPGMGKYAPIEVNEEGGKQALLNYRFDLIDPLPIFRLASILGEGAARYGEWNWRRIAPEDNMNHALAHIFAHLAGDKQDDHLGHAFCRLMFSLSMEMTPGVSPRMSPDGRVRAAIRP